MIERDERERDRAVGKGTARNRWGKLISPRETAALDDHALNVALHKRLAAAEGNDRSKQGVVANTGDC